MGGSFEEFEVEEYKGWQKKQTKPPLGDVSERPEAEIGPPIFPPLGLLRNPESHSGGFV